MNKEITFRDRQHHLNNLERHFAHVLRKRGISDGTNTLINEMLHHVDTEVFLSRLSQEEWESLPLEERYSMEELEAMAAAGDEST